MKKKVGQIEHGKEKDGSNGTCWVDEEDWSSIDKVV